MICSKTSLSASIKALLLCAGLGFSGIAMAGGQVEEAPSASVQASMQKAISDAASPEPIFSSEEEKLRWLTEMSPRLAKRLPDTRDRVEFLKTVYYEAQRAGL